MMVITNSILLYGTKVCADALKVDCRWRILSWASERKRVWETKNVNGETVNVGDARKRTILYWQEK